MQLPPSISPSELASMLGRRGLNVTERALTDWRSKGLLPSLKSRSLGRAGGRKYFWRSPAVVAQATAVQEFFSRKYPDGEIALALWFLGFHLNPVKVRNAWLSRLAILETRLKTLSEVAEKDQGHKFSI